MYVIFFFFWYWSWQWLPLSFIFLKVEIQLIYIVVFISGIEQCDLVCIYIHTHAYGFPGGTLLKNLPAMQETQF